VTQQEPNAAQSEAWDLIPVRPTLPKLRAAAAGCRACRLWRNATQTVFGEGTAAAEVMMVGEQPGDREDLAGKPFVGPAGKLLDKALDEAAIDRRTVYVTNVVKHFKFEPRGKRRIHEKPAAEEIAACRPWLQSELEVVKPRVLGLPGSHRGPGSPWPDLPPHSASGPVRRIGPGPSGHRHGPSFGRPARPR
jgi:uracil-DNA glycosylase family protein